MSAFFNRYTLLIGILLAIVVLSPGPGTGRAGAAVHDSAHAPGFACVTFVLLILLKRYRARPLALADYGTAFVLGAGLGLATEIVQRFMGGDSSWLDLLSDAIGAAVACGVFASFDRRISIGMRVGLATAAVAALVLHSVQFVRVGVAFAHREQDFPILFDAANRRAELFVVGRRSIVSYTILPAALAKRPSEPSLRVQLVPGLFPGVAVEEPYPDWSRYTLLKLDLANPEERPFELQLRVHDQVHNWDSDDRFQEKVRLAPNARTIVTIPIEDIARAPRHRRMDTRSIADLRLYTDRRDAGRTFYVTRVWLE